jgi:hypothetical protein
MNGAVVLTEAALVATEARPMRPRRTLEPAAGGLFDVCQLSLATPRRDRARATQCIEPCRIELTAQRRFWIFVLLREFYGKGQLSNHLISASEIIVLRGKIALTRAKTPGAPDKPTVSAPPATFQRGDPIGDIIQLACDALMSILTRLAV